MMMTMYQHRIQFLSTPSARRATVIRIIAAWSMLFLSTPSARRATELDCQKVLGVRISIHALREEGDCQPSGLRSSYGYFYPRPPRGGRPRGPRRSCRGPEHFYPRPPRGGRLSAAKIIKQIMVISIHALREEGDDDFRPDRGGRAISIHALREEGDLCKTVSRAAQQWISIHALREEGDT